MATLDTGIPFTVACDPFKIGPMLQLATGPLGTESIELVWEINDVLPYDGSGYRSATATFTGSVPELQRTLTFEILAGLDGENFTAIGSAPGSVNRFRHENVVTGRLYYYKIKAVTEAGRQWGESRVVMGAAGPNLARPSDFEQLPLGTCLAAEEHDGALRVPDNRSCSVIEGARPYTDGTRIIRADPKPPGTQRNLHVGADVPLDPDKTYLQGGWIRAPGNIWYGRRFHDEEHEVLSWSYVMSAVHDTPEWTFGVQLLVPDTDGGGFRHRDDGRIFEMALKHWLFPPVASTMRIMVVAFSPGECDDLWIVEAERAPADATVLP